MNTKIIILLTGGLLIGSITPLPSFADNGNNDIGKLPAVRFDPPNLHFWGDPANRNGAPKATAKSIVRQLTSNYFSKTNQLKWEKFSSRQLPKNAINLGSTQNPLYACQARHNGEVYPGQLVSSQCIITVGKKAFKLTDYSVLTGSDQQLIWKEADEHQLLAQLWQNRQSSTKFTPQIYGVLPENADLQAVMLSPVIGGVTGNNGQLQSMYICKITQDGNAYLGKQSNGSCQIAGDADKVQDMIIGYQLLSIKVNVNAEKFLK